MKKTVGDLVYEQAIKDGYNPNLSAEKLIPPVAKDALKALTKTKEQIEGPLTKQLKVIKSAYSSIAPQLERIAEMNKIVQESYIIPERRIQNVRIVNTEEIATESKKKEKTVVVASYILPKNATWESLDIKFLDGHLVKVSYPGLKSQKFDFKDMGFMNTKTNNPDYKWALLRLMAEDGGALTNSKWDKRFGRNVKYELNEGLKKFFGMRSSPISHYTKKYGYKALFSLRADK